MSEAVTDEAVDAATLAMLKACGGECIEAPSGELCVERLGCACRAEARAALSAALPLVVAGERERAERIARTMADEMDAIQMQYGGVGSGDPVAVRCQRVADTARQLATAIRADKGGGPDG